MERLLTCINAPLPEVLGAQPVHLANNSDCSWPDPPSWIHGSRASSGSPIDAPCGWLAMCFTPAGRARGARRFGRRSDTSVAMLRRGIVAVMIRPVAQLVSYLPPSTDDLRKLRQHLAHLCQQEREATEGGKDDQAEVVPTHEVTSDSCCTGARCPSKRKVALPKRTSRWSPASRAMAPMTPTGEAVSDAATSST